jgi:hypothetical protein
MIETSEQWQNVERIIDAHRRGLRDKVQTIELLRTLFATLKPEDQREVCEQLGYLLRTQPLGTTAAVRGVAVNVVGVALLALARFGPTEHLAEFVFSRIKLDDAKEMETWAREVSPDLRYCLYEQGDRFSDDALVQIRQSIAKSRPTDKSLPLSLIEALNELEITLDNIELTRFEKSLRHAASQDKSEAAHLASAGALHRQVPTGVGPSKSKIGLSLERSLSAPRDSWIPRAAYKRENQGGRPRGDKLGEGFSHSPDYRSVTIRGKPHTLTARQAQMIQILHEAEKKGTPDVSIAYIQEQLETRNSRWQDTWRSNSEARKALIKTGARRGTLRLKL